MINGIRDGYSLIHYASLFALLISTVLVTLSETPIAKTAQVAELIPLSDKDWDYWSNEPDLTVIPSGNVAIGVATPTAKLDVNGDLQVSDQIISTVAS